MPMSYSLQSVTRNLIRISSLLILLFFIFSFRFSLKNKGGYNSKIISIEEKSYNAVLSSDSIKRGTRYRRRYTDQDFIIYYNIKGQITEKTLYDSQDRVYEKIVYFYNSSNKVISKKTFDENKIKEIDSFDSHEVIIEKTTYSTGNKYIWIYKNVYKKNKLTKQEKYKSNQKLIRVLTYNKKQKLVLDEDVGTRFGKGSKVVFKYDKKNNLLEKIQYNEKGVISKKMNFTYDKRSNLKEKSMSESSNEILKKWIYCYDNNNNVISEKITDYERKTIKNWSFKYTFDKFNNWVQKIEYDSKNKPIFLVERKITYSK